MKRVLKILRFIKEEFTNHQLVLVTLSLTKSIFKVKNAHLN